MAFSGNPITHNFAVTAFGRSKRPASALESDDRDDIPSARHRRSAHGPQSGDPQVFRGVAQQPASLRYSPNRGLTDVTATRHSSFEESTQPGTGLVGQQDKDAELHNEGGDRAFNAMEEDEVIEISSDEDEAGDGDETGTDDVENDSKLDLDEAVEIYNSSESPHNRAEKQMQSDPRVPADVAAPVGSSTAHVGLPLTRLLLKKDAAVWSNKHPSLSALADRVPVRFATKGRSRKVQQQVWLSIFAYFNHLHGTRLKVTKKVQDSKNGFQVIKVALMNCLCTEFGRQFTKRKTGEVEQNSQNLEELISSLQWYFDKFGEHMTETTQAENAASTKSFSKKGSSGAQKSLPATLVPTSAQLEVEGGHSSHQRASEYLRELSVTGPYKRAWNNASQYEAAGYYIKAKPNTEESLIRPELGKQPTSVVQDNSSTGQASEPVATKDQVVGRHITSLRGQDLDHHQQPAASTKVAKTRLGPEALRAKSVTTTIPTPRGSSNPSPSSNVYDSVNALKSVIKKATEQKVDWSKVPDAILEAEMAVKRIQTALEKAKVAIAQHGDDI